MKMIPANPIRGLSLPPMPSRGEETVLTPADYDRLLNSIPDEPFRLFVTALRLTGARPSEVARVTAGNFNPEAGTWTFDEHKTSKKTGRKRVVLLVPELVVLCQQLAERFPDGPLFRNTKGRPWSVKAVIKRFHRLQGKLGIRCIAYGCRHSFATTLLQTGMADHDVAALLGHVGTTMLHKHYAHLLSDTRRLRDSLVAHLARTTNGSQQSS
jgi:integrase